ncbi:hypothetical protein GCM10009834_20280 [Streptomonospora arabica]
MRRTTRATPRRSCPVVPSEGRVCRRRADDELILGGSDTQVRSAGARTRAHRQEGPSLGIGAESQAESAANPGSG